MPHASSEGCYFKFYNHSAGANIDDWTHVTSAQVITAEWNFLSNVPQQLASSAAPTHDLDNELGCDPCAGTVNLSGKIAIVYRGGCFLAVKAMCAHEVGFVALLITNHIGPGLLFIAGEDPKVRIPAFMSLRHEVQPVLDLPAAGVVCGRNDAELALP